MSSPTSKALLAQEHLVVVTASAELLRSIILVWVIVVSVLASDVMVVVHVGGILLGLVVRTLAVPFIHA